MSASSASNDLISVQETNNQNKRKRQTGKLRKVNGAPISSTVVATAMTNELTSESTKENYNGKTRQMLNWYKEKYSNDPTCHSNDPNSIINWNQKDFTDFLGEICAYSNSHVRSYRSALIDLFTNNKKKIGDDFSADINKVLDGYEKVVNQLKQRGLMKINEGKSPIEAKGFMLLAFKFLIRIPGSASDRDRGGNWNASLFAWPFFLFMWNLMSRSDSVDTLMLTHIKWEGDSLQIHGKRRTLNAEC